MPGPPAAAVSQLGRENAVVLTTVRGEEIRLADVRVEGDSLIGLRSIRSGERAAVALADVRSVAITEEDLLPGVVVIFTSAALAFVLLMISVKPWYGT